MPNNIKSGDTVHLFDEVLGCSYEENYLELYEDCDNPPEWRDGDPVTLSEMLQLAEAASAVVVSES